MWCEKLKSGNYRFKKYYENITGGQSTVSTTLKTNSRQSWNKAEMLLNQKIQEILDGDALKGTDSLSDVVSAWLAVKKKSVRPSTYKDYQSRIGSITDHIGDRAIKTIKAPEVNRILLDMLNSGLSYKTVNERAKLFKKVITFAVQFGYLDSDNITNLISIPEINLSIKRDDKYLESSEAEKLFKAMKDDGYDVYADMLKLQMQTGMRFGEVAALTVDDLKIDGIYINRSYDRKNKTFGPTKNGKPRTIYINMQTQRLLKDIKKRRKLLLISYGVRNNDLLFFRSSGEPVDISPVNELLHHYESSDKKLTTHIFRHTFVTRAVENNIPPKQIAEMVGHSGTELIDRVYAHFSDKMRQDLKTSIQKIVF